MIPVREERPPEPIREAPTVTKEEEREGGIYSPPGWGAPAPEAPAEDLLMFTADSDMSDLGLDLGVPEDEEHLADLRDQMFAEEEEEAGRQKKKARKPPKKIKAPILETMDIDETIDITLPDGVVPTQMSMEEEEEVEGEEWAEAEEWEEEEEEWDDLEEEDWEELEEEGWVEEEEEWEDEAEEEEEEDDVLIVTCRCGEEIEIPPEFSGTKFRCPNCGRKDKIPGR
jgi:hypothetical protein